MPPKKVAATVVNRPRRATRASARHTNPTASPSSTVTTQDATVEAPTSTPPTAATGPRTPATRASRSSCRRSIPSVSPAESNPKSGLEDRREVRLLETLDDASLKSPETAAAESNANVSPSRSSGEVMEEEDAAKDITSLVSPESAPVAFAESIPEENPSIKDAEKGEALKEALVETSNAGIEAQQSDQIVGVKLGEISTGETASSEPVVGRKPVVRRTVRVVKKVVKKKVLRKVPKSALESLNKQSGNPQVEVAAKSPNPIVTILAHEGENHNSSVSSHKEAVSVEVPGGSGGSHKEVENIEFRGGSGDSNPLTSVSVEGVDKLEGPVVQGSAKYRNPIIPGSVEDVKDRTSGGKSNLFVPMEEVENLGNPVSMEAEDPTSNVTISMEMEKPNEHEYIDGLKDGSAVNVQSKDQSLDLREAQTTAEADIEVPNAYSIGEHNENVDSCSAEVMEVEKFDAHGSSKECEMGKGMTLLSEEMEALERRKRRKTELFIGGLDKDAKEEDIRKVFEEVGKVVEVRLVMKGQTGKNKGFAFLRYASATDAKRALEKYSKVKICGKECGTSLAEGNDTIFLGNLDKKWKNEDVMKLLNDIGIEKIDTVTVMPDPSNVEFNRGFAFLELETKRDAQNAFRKLQKKDVFGKHVKISVAWAEPLADQDEEEMRKVKSVYAEFVPSSWDEDKVKDFFKRFGEVDNVVLARNLHSSKRKDFAFVHFTNREAALSCIESFSRELFDHGGSKVNMKVSIAKPIPKGKHNKRASNSISKEIPKEKPKTATQRVSNLTNEGQFLTPTRWDYQVLKGDRSSSTNAELLHLLREQSSRNQSHGGSGLGSVNPAYPRSLPVRKRPISLLDHPVYSDPRVYTRARVGSSYPVASSSYDSFSPAVGMGPPPYYQHHAADYRPGHGLTDYTRNFQREGAPYHGIGGLYHRYR